MHIKIKYVNILLGDDMNCKNCGTRLSDKAKVCPNCGAFVDDSSGYTLLASNDRYYDVYSTEKKTKKKKSPFRSFLVFVLVILIAGGGTFLYFDKIAPMINKQPEMSFNQGSGIINKKDKVIYVLLDKSSNIQYIHGVALYNYDRTQIDEIREPVSTDYEYTKSIDSTFRSIFFDTKDYNINKDEKYTYTFEMKFSFTGSDKIYTYLHPVTFSGNITEDASDIIFDHTLNEGSAGNKKPESQTEKEDKNDKADYSFIHSGYWYTSPSTENGVRSISAFKFDEGGSYTVTHYVKNGDEDWKVSNENGTYKIEKDELILSLEGAFTLDSENEEIYESADSKKTQTLTNRKYNSLANTEDFFGL